MNTNAQHKLFMLRLWREAKTEPWRITIQSSESTKPVGLPNPTALIAHLEHAMAGNLPSQLENRVKPHPEVGQECTTKYRTKEEV